MLSQGSIPKKISKKKKRKKKEKKKKKKKFSIFEQARSKSAVGG